MHMLQRPPAIIGTLLLLGLLMATWTRSDARGHAQPERGIVGQPAPSWGVEMWHNLPAGARSVDIAAYRGKVVYLYCFQSWCPGCHSHGFPTLQGLIARYEGVDDVAFVAVQTAFEGHGTNNAAAARRAARRYGLTIPVGHDGTARQRPDIMGRYRTGGTPWTIIIDKNGVVRFNAFHTTVTQAGMLIDRLRAEKAPAPNAAPNAAPSSVPVLPAGRGGQDVVGTKMPALRFDAWHAPRTTAGAPPMRARPAAGRVTLYRWWTDGCSFCEASLPAIERLRTKYAAKGLEVVGAYHPKPPRRVSSNDIKDVRASATRLGYHGRIAIDQDWSELKRWYHQGGTRRTATSVTVVVDDRGVIRFVHPGPVLFPSEKPEHTRENEDFTLLDQALDVLLNEARARARAAR